MEGSVYREASGIYLGCEVKQIAVFPNEKDSMFSYRPRFSGPFVEG